MPTPTEIYHQWLAAHGHTADSAQQAALVHSERLYDQLKEPARGSWFGLRKTAPVTGIYLWGDCGRGKTVIMDGLYEALPSAHKARYHLHQFLRQVHHQLRDLPKSPDPLPRIAKDLAKQFRLLYLDEFHVDDITDAMIMAGLLAALFRQGITLIATSNYAPDDLYPNGLQRQRFTPAIELIKQHMQVVELRAERDYRQRLHCDEELYFDDAAQLPQVFQRYAGDDWQQPGSVLLNHRQLAVKGVNHRAIWLDFPALCATPRAADDYIALAEQYEIILIEDIPLMGEGQNDQAARFIQLIDALYDRHRLLLAHTRRQPEELYQGQSLAFSFQRTISRLNEMRSQPYLASTDAGRKA